jgi:hypothetical protein
MDRKKMPRKKSDKSHFFLDEIKTSYKNSYLYHPCGIDNQDDQALVESIRESGIQEPLVITSDGYLVSGHRRRWAAKYLGLKTVPVRVIEERFETLAQEEQLRLLRRFNHQREKTHSEKLREISLDLDPKVTHAKLRRRSLQKTIKAITDSGNITLGRRKKRPKITTTQFLGAVKQVIKENEEYLPLTDRRLHYLLLNDPPLRHDKKPGSHYKNDRASYQALTSLLTRARLSGEIPMWAIEDPTRPIRLSDGFDNFQQFFKQETENFLNGYYRNLMQGQEAHIEVLLEKAALSSVVERIARRYCIPVTTTRGFPSLTPRFEVVQRFHRSGKRVLVLLILSDFDPDGEMIASSIARSLRDDFGVPERSMRAKKVGLTYDDILKNDFPSDLEAKPSSPNYAAFVAQYGERVVELDAAPVEWIQEKLRGAIEAEIDLSEFAAQQRLEEQDSVYIEAQRILLLNALGASGADGYGKES